MPETAAYTGKEAARSVDVHAGQIESGALFGPEREVIISHNGEPYRLRITASGKLILTK